MVQGPTHAMSGAAAGLALSTALPATWGGATGTAEILAFTGLTAGAALLPDLDAPGSTVARAFGPLTGLVARLAASLSVLVVNATASRGDTRITGGHRTATHTLWFALLAGALAWGIGGASGDAGVVGMLVFLSGLALRGLFPRWSGGRAGPVVVVVAVGLGIGAWYTVPALRTPLMPASAVTVGVIVHLAGDMLTKSGVPLTSPLIPRGGKRWWNWTLPGAVTVRTSGVRDQALLLVFTALTAWQLHLVLMGG
ncbi:metal-dependent hydrolase [uncultured Corynebacterium sp.]|uniref:metal-dependent hydrolase n=1 Tax=uncultured Corynebacterium sp. TaxID=159447 RepID=UPI0025D9F3E6|nr:metal-dependent hydrolase [uncultured Corynebacterium sp.]